MDGYVYAAAKAGFFCADTDKVAFYRFFKRGIIRYLACQYIIHRAYKPCITAAVSSVGFTTEETSTFGPPTLCDARLIRSTA